MTQALRLKILRFATFSIFLSVAILTTFGLIMLYSTTWAIDEYTILQKQLIWICLGVTAAFLIQKISYQLICRHSFLILLIVTLPLLYLATVHIFYRLGVSNELLAHFPLVHKGTIRGTYRWLYIGEYSLQPSEFAKLAIILFLSYYYGKYPRYIYSLKRGLIYPLFFVGCVIMAILLGGSLSVASITGIVVLAILFIPGIRLRYFIIFVSLGLLLIQLVVSLSPERLDRILTYRNPEKHKRTGGYQLWVAQLALGRGGWFGVGFNQSLLKHHYIPEVHTDFIMAIVGEELGLITVELIILLYLFFLISACIISMLAVDRMGLLLAFGIGLMISLHAFVNIAVITGLLPTTGINIPLISYGGSNMLTTWLGIGLLWNVARRSQNSEIAAAMEKSKLIAVKSKSFLNSEKGKIKTGLFNARGLSFT